MELPLDAGATQETVFTPLLLVTVNVSTESGTSARTVVSVVSAQGLLPPLKVALTW